MGKKAHRKRAASLAIVTTGLSERSRGLDRVVSEAEAAQILGFSQDTLRREFRAGRAPPRIRLSGRRIGYRLSSIYAFLDAHTEQPGARP